MINSSKFANLVKLVQLTGAKQGPIRPYRCYSTIYALSSGLHSYENGRQKTGVAIAVLRISGPQTGHVLNSLTNGQLHRFRPRQAKLTNLYNERDLIDKAIAIYFPAPNSYTGEDMCELHVHGSRSVVQTVLSALSRFADTKPAEQGEFTKRAFLNQKLSLIEAEAINDLIESNCDSQRRNALKGLSGNVQLLYEEWRQKLIRLHAFIQADIEFGEDQLLDEERIDRTIQGIFQIKNEIEEFLKISSRRRHIVKQGLKLCILGCPNVGKSSLMNSLCDKELSIVSPFQGTTRDVIEHSLEINGYQVHLSDTAGIRQLDGSDESFVENEGIRRALDRAKTADILIHLIDASKLHVQGELLAKRTLYLDEQLNQFYAADKRDKNSEQVCSNHSNPFASTATTDTDASGNPTGTESANTIHVLNKIDLVAVEERQKLADLFGRQRNVIQLSCRTGENLVDLIQLIGDSIETRIAADNPARQDDFITERHENHLQRIVENIRLAIDTEDRSISAYYVEQSINEIASITGTITTEQILDVIFQNFCIGK